VLKFVLTFSSIAFVLALAPAQAQQSCSEASITRMEAQAKQLADEGKKQAAMKEMRQARERMAQNQIGECNTHMGNAADLMQVGR
jgi:hypothetical protein